VEFVGYIVRGVAHSNTGKLMPYIVQSTFLLLPPVLFAATVYMVLGRIIRSVHGERHSPVRVNWLTATFVFGDVVSFCVQGGGAGLMATENNAALGEKMVVAGLLIQVAVFWLFCATAGVFHYRYHSHSAGATATGPEGGTGGWRRGMYMLYSISALILVRSLFRVVEFSLGREGYPLMHEWMLFVFDSILMLAVMVIFYVWHPSRLQRREEGKSISSGTTPEEGSVGVELKDAEEGRH